MASMTHQPPVSPLRPTRRMPVPMVQGRNALLLLLTIGLVAAVIVSVGAQQQLAARSAPVAAPIMDAPVGHEHYLHLRGWLAGPRWETLAGQEIGSAYVSRSTAPIVAVPSADPQLWLIGPQPLGSTTSRPTGFPAVRDIQLDLTGPLPVTE